MELSTQEKKIIKQIAEENRFDNFEIEVERGSNKGDNFMGVIKRVTFKNGEKKMVMVVKSSQHSEFFTKEKTADIFNREIYLYDHVFEEFSQFQEEQNISNKFNAHARLLGKSEGKNGEFFVLEDMREKGLQMCKKTITMNVYHIEAVLREYAKFHSASLAMKAKQPERFKLLTSCLDDLMQNDEKKDEFTKISKSIMQNAYKVVVDDPLATKILERHENNFAESMFTSDTSSDDITVVTHGDCWCNNFLFKYKDQNNTDIPSEICILDWQLSKLGSIGGDLAYFLLANGSEDVLYNYEKYLKIYYEMLSQNLTEFSCDPDEILGFEKLVEQFKKYCKLMFLFVLMVMRIQLCESDEAPDFLQMKKGDDIEDVINFKLGAIDEYNRRILILIKFMIKSKSFD